MQDAVRIEAGYHIIDTPAWVRQRTSGPVTDLTTALNEFTDHPLFNNLYTLDTSARMQLWAAARGWITSEETTHHHTDDSLSEPVSIVLATGPDRCAYALIQIGHDAPAVYLDRTTDDDHWGQVEPIDIVCLTGHRFTWLDHTTVLDEGGTYRDLRDVFGRARGAPYVECRDCLAYDNGDRDEVCGCDGRYTIYCPTCDQRCRLELTPVPTIATPALVPVPAGS